MTLDGSTEGEGLLKAEYVAAYIQEQTGTEDEWQLQRLIYYADAWALAWTGRPLVGEGFEAWKYGPVCRELWNRRQAIKGEGVESPQRFKLSSLQTSIVDAVLDYYVRLSPRSLMEKTRGKPPWVNMRRGLSDDSHGCKLIDREEVMRFYATEALEGRAPVVPPQVASPGVGSSQSERIDKLARKWSPVLERLAEL